MISAPKKILVVPDSFKGTLSAEEASAAISRGFKRVFPQTTILEFPMADGGEGSSSIVGRIVGAEKIALAVTGPENTEVQGFYFLDTKGRAFIEMAAASGITLVDDLNHNPHKRTTFGTGELILDAVRRGAKEIFVFFGGSATSDGGVGIARALGYEFYDRFSAVMKFPEGDLREIHRIKKPQGLRLPQITAIVDVDNPLCGKTGAAYIYGPQKGLTSELVREVDAGLKFLAATVNRDLEINLEQEAGSGAAGGSSYGLRIFAGASLKRGPEFFLDLINFNDLLKDTSLVITGEGKIDSQSVKGKLFLELYQRANREKVPVLSLCGVVDVPVEELAQLDHFYAFGLGRADGMQNTGGALEALAFETAKLICSNIPNNY
ncbi:glycerate kinase [bacterium]|nr:glycerate kinase [bacterium]